MSKCDKCSKKIQGNAKFCGICGAEQVNNQKEKKETRGEQKNFKLDMSKDNNRISLMGIGFIILLKFLGPLVGSYLVAGIILGVLFAIIEYSYNK